VTAGLTLGAPGVYQVAVPPVPAVAPVRLDATGFVGMALRGPANQPVRVGSWSEFVEVFGGVNDLVGGAPRPWPGYLPRAVRAFFDQGGQVAWVCRVVPVDDDPAATARMTLAAGLVLAAANEGSWGAKLTARLDFVPGQPLPRRWPPDADRMPADQLVIADGPPLPDASLLAVSPCDGHPAGTLHRLTGQSVRPASGSGRERVLTVEPPLPDAALRPGAAVDVRLVTGTLSVLDGDPLRRREEQITGLGLYPEHPRYPARQVSPDHPAYPATVLAAESGLVRNDGDWTTPLMPADATLPPLTAGPATGGADRFDRVGLSSLFDGDSPDGDPLDERDDHRGVDRMARVADLGLLCVPDLTWVGGPGSLDPGDPGAGFLDPGTPDGLEAITARQQKLIDVVAPSSHDRRRFTPHIVALLDAPSGLSVAGLGRWRASFDSTYAAAYHPWLGVPGDEPGRRAVPLPPSAVAAGIIAARERRLGLPWGPANELAVNVVIAADDVPDAVHDQLHLLHINVFRSERDGFRLTSARTLSRDPRYRQLSVRRLMTMITLALAREADTLVFEPNNPGLRATVTHVISQFLRDLFRQGAFAGASEQESFFVRCDEALNPPESQALGRLVTEVGVAPSSPLEYLVLRISQELDGTSAVTPVVAPGAALPPSPAVASGSGSGSSATGGVL